jgi:murein DD-endopeptidase MepM/ murein hydrolase activator NlpD
MVLKSGRAWFIGVIVATLLLPASGPLAETSLEKLRDKLADIKDDIEAHEAKAKNHKEEAQALNDSMVRLRKELATLDTDLAEVEARLRSVQANIDEQQAEIDKLKIIATKQARALYMSGQSDIIEALLDAQSLTDLDSRIAMLDVASEEHTGALVEYSRLKAEIELKYQDKYKIKKELEEKQEIKQELHAELKKRYKQHREILNRLERILDKEHALEENVSDKIDTKVRALLRARQASAIPPGVTIPTGEPSAAGFIWPLNGAITSYYGPRWGRMHTGIDIDGSTGDPIVASKAGRVILASYYYGYGNAVIIDHGHGYSTLYGHMTSFGVSNGQVVAQGQIVGTVGCTGSCTGPHLHFEVRVNGSPRDPLIYLP